MRAANSVSKGKPHRLDSQQLNCIFHSTSNLTVHQRIQVTSWLPVPCLCWGVVTLKNSVSSDHDHCPFLHFLFTTIWIFLQLPWATAIRSGPNTSLQTHKTSVDGTGLWRSYSSSVLCESEASFWSSSSFSVWSGDSDVLGCMFSLSWSALDRFLFFEDFFVLPSFFLVFCLVFAMSPFFPVHVSSRQPRQRTRTVPKVRQTAIFLYLYLNITIFLSLSTFTTSIQFKLLVPETRDCWVDSRLIFHRTIVKMWHLGKTGLANAVNSGK